MNASGQWRGISRGKMGTFKFINVELLSKRTVKAKKKIKWHRNIKEKPISVEDLLQKINLPEYISVFILNGYEDLELFKEIEPSDLDFLGIGNTDHRTKILTAVQLLHDLDSDSEGDLPGSSSKNEKYQQGVIKEIERNKIFGDTCYDESTKITQKSEHITRLSELNTSDSVVNDNKNNLDDLVEKCNNEILARTRQAQKNSFNLKTELFYEANISSNIVSNFADRKEVKKKTKNVNVSFHNKTILIDSDSRNVLNRASSQKTLEEICEADQMTLVKYVIDTTSGLPPNETGSLNVLRRSCLSEKSSDSGVSSSSLSSANTKEYHPVLPEHLIDTSEHGDFNLSICANCTSTTANKDITFQ